MPGKRKEPVSHKYNKVNQQRKFHLLSLYYKHRVPLKEVSLLGYRRLSRQGLTFSQPRPSFSSTKKNISLTCSTSDFLLSCHSSLELGLPIYLSRKTNFSPSRTPDIAPRFSCFVLLEAFPSLLVKWNHLKMETVHKNTWVRCFKRETKNIKKDNDNKR